MKRVVLDTNVLVSALFFGGRLEPLVERWKAHALIPLFSRATFAEFRKVLTYPRFGLTEQEIGALIEDEILPYCDVIEIAEEIQGVCRDPGDDIFLSCAFAAGAEAIVSGDRDLLDLGSFRNIPILSVTDFLRKYNRGTAPLCAAGQGRVIKRVRIPPRKEGHPPGSESLEVWW